MQESFHRYNLRQDSTMKLSKVYANNPFFGAVKLTGVWWTLFGMPSGLAGKGELSKESYSQNRIFRNQSTDEESNGSLHNPVVQLSFGENKLWRDLSRT